MIALGLALLLAAGEAEVWAFPIGQQLPDVSLVALEGGPACLPRASGAPVVVNIFASWCGPCRMEMPRLEREIWSRYRAAGVQVIGVDRGEPLDPVIRHVARLGVTYPIMLDTERAFFEAISSDGKGIPKTLLLDGAGAVVWRENGFDPNRTIPELQRRIEELLAGGK